MLSQEDLTRYTRQMMFPDWGTAGQEKIQAATVFIAGAGGLGSPVALYLAAAGIGHLRICDYDRIDITNLNRQILHGTPDIGRLKVESARERVQHLNPGVDIQVFAEALDTHNLTHLIGESDIIVDCLDNIATRRLLNRYAASQHIPFVYGGVHGMTGMTSVFHPPDTPCFECIFPDNPETEMFPVIGATPGIIGSIQALETLKYLTELGTVLKGRLLIVDGERMDFRTIQMAPNPDCQVCSKPKSIVPGAAA